MSQYHTQNSGRMTVFIIHNLQIKEVEQNLFLIYIYFPGRLHSDTPKSADSTSPPKRKITEQQTSEVATDNTHPKTPENLCLPEPLNITPPAQPYTQSRALPPKRIYSDSGFLK